MVYRTKAACLGLCNEGPIAVVYPEGVWYHKVDAKAARAICEEHLRHGRPVASHVMATDDLRADDLRAGDLRTGERLEPGPGGPTVAGHADDEPAS